jgi:hypothetical protein
MWLSELRAAALVGEDHPLGTATRHSLDRNRAPGDPGHFGTAQAGIASDGEGEAGAAFVAAPVAIPIPIAVPDDGPDTVRSDPQFQILCRGNLRGCGDGTECQSEGNAHIGKGLKHLFLRWRGAAVDDATNAIVNDRFRASARVIVRNGYGRRRDGLHPVFSAKPGRPRSVHEQFLLRSEGTEELQQTCFLCPVKTVAFRKFAHTPDLAETLLFELLQVDPLTHLNPQNATFRL